MVYINFIENIFKCGKIYVERCNMKTCAVIYNPISGKKVNFNVMPQFEKILKNYGYESKIIYTKYKGHATEIIRFRTC